jgi:hypothetical protein|tara:strand:- start:403 stop:624 length:222 start_codon:yes stop_codon:yes gene_type:complete
MKARRMQDVIKNLKDLIVLSLVVGVLSLLGVIIIGDYYVALQENRPVDESVITLMKMALTGLIGIIAGYMGSR